MIQEDPKQEEKEVEDEEKAQVEEPVQKKRKTPGIIVMKDHTNWFQVPGAGWRHIELDGASKWAWHGDPPPTAKDFLDILERKHVHPGCKLDLEYMENVLLPW